MHVAAVIADSHSIVDHFEAPTTPLGWATAIAIAFAVLFVIARGLMSAGDTSAGVFWKNLRFFLVVVAILLIYAATQADPTTIR